MKANEWEVARMDCPPEELPPTHFTEPFNGECVHCKLPESHGKDIPGIVKVRRDNNGDYRVVADGAWCLYCGQRYYILPEHLEKFLGHSAHPSLVKYEWWQGE